jgi:hypothetical protein
MRPQSIATAAILVCGLGALATISLICIYYPSLIKTSDPKSVIEWAIADDGCEFISNWHSSSWKNMTESETEDVLQLRQCLSQIVYDKDFHLDDIHPRAIRGQLNCNTQVSFETVWSMLSQYNTVWFHGDSIMGQVFYSLSCMMNSTIVWNSTRIMEQHTLGAVGLGKATYEQFTYRHDAGITTLIYSRFGQMWNFDDNLFRYDFPEALRTLS